jgi:hypothetical protein
VRHGRISAMTNVPQARRTPHAPDAAGAASKLGAIF